ncbi:hypothetical protein DOM01_02040, partial [Salmonella enterica subsp. enterica serovar Derby]
IKIINEINTNTLRHKLILSQRTTMKPCGFIVTNDKRTPLTYSSQKQETAAWTNPHGRFPLILTG